MKIAIVHDYLHQFGGAEKVVEKWLEVYPEADLYTSFYTPQKFSTSKYFEKARQDGRIYTTWLQMILPKIMKFYKHFFWLYPIVMSFRVVKNYDVVLISSTYCGKNVRYRNVKKIIHYCHSPVRFLHGLVTETDHRSINPILRSIIPVFTFPLKWMDLQAVSYLNKNGCIWIANSKFIQETILDVYKTKSKVIYPPIELETFLKINRSGKKPGDFYLSHGRISFHKRIDLAILACLQTGRKLKVSGTAAFEKELDSLKNLVHDYEVENPESKGLIEFLGRTTNEKLQELMTTCRGFIFPGKEDFGIAPIEMLAAGVPIIAYKSGGALEYVQNGKNGIFFNQQSIFEVITALYSFEKTQFNSKTIKDSSKPFSEKAFRDQIDSVVRSKKN
jgi:glycosyltransferase involved in cell wall biosynthesis